MARYQRTVWSLSVDFMAAARMSLAGVKWDLALTFSLSLSLTGPITHSLTDSVSASNRPSFQKTVNSVDITRNDTKKYCPCLYHATDEIVSNRKRDRQARPKTGYWLVGYRLPACRT